MPTDLLDRAIPPAGRIVRYGPGAAQFGDLRLPEGPGPHPLAIVVHGGAWRSVATLDRTAHLCVALTRDGIATWNIEYRRLGSTGGGWPMTLTDVADAMDAVVDLARLHPIDLAQTAVLGHSSGGALALWLAGRARVPAGSDVGRPPAFRLCGAVSLSGLLDLARASELGLRDAFENRVSVHDFLGGPPSVFPGRYAATSPAQLVPLGIPQLIIHGATDDRVPHEIARRYVAAARAAGDDAKLLTFADIDHYDAIDPQSEVYPHLRTWLREIA